MQRNAKRFAAVACFFLFLTPFLVSAEPVALKLASQNPETSHSHVQCILPWAKKVEEATKNAVTIKIYPGQTLAKGPDQWTAVKNGISDISWCFHGYWPNMTPLSDVMSLPGLPFKTGEKGSEVLWKLHEKFPAIQKEHSSTKVLLFYTSHPYFLITSSKQVKTIEDMKGLKLRMTGGPPTEMLTALGGTPMLMPMPDVYMGMQKGVLDGMAAPWEAVQGFRLYEVAKYYLDVPFPAVYFSVVINKQKWDTLTTEVQNAILSVSGLEGSKFWGRNWFDSAKDAVYAKAESIGKKINYENLSQTERDRWIDVSVKPLWQKWVKDMEVKGFQDAQQILDEALVLSK